MNENLQSGEPDRVTPALSVYLDALRLLAALMVFAHHASYPIFGGRWISALGGYGHEAVVVFFVLSGFVIAFVTDAKERTPRAYAASRLSRLWSVALPALAATLAMDAIGKWLAPQAYADVLINPLGPLASALFVNEFWTAQWHVGSNIPFWSLSYEAAYYLLFGIFVFAPMRWLWLAAAAALIGPKILLLAPAWIAGVIAFRAAQRIRTATVDALLAVLGAALAFGLSVSKVGNLYVTWRWQKWLGDPVFEAMGHASAFLSDNLIAFALAAHLVGLAGLLRHVPVQPTLHRLIAKASIATFPIYLFHYPALYFFSALSFTLFGERVGVFIGLSSLALSVAVTPLCESLRALLRPRIGARSNNR